MDVIWTDMADPLHPTPEERQREQYLPKWAQDLLRELRYMVNERRYSSPSVQPWKELR